MKIEDISKSIITLEEDDSIFENAAVPVEEIQEEEKHEESMEEYFERMLSEAEKRKSAVYLKQQGYDRFRDGIDPEDSERPVLPEERKVEIPLEDLYDFPNHPFPVEDNDALEELVSSISENGILTPLMVINRYRGSISDDNDGKGYYIVSGHRRKIAAKKAGMKTVPCIIEDWTYDTATQAMVETNIHRPDSEITPMVKARAYELYMQANKIKQGTMRGSLDKMGDSPIKRKTTRDKLSRITGDSGRNIDKYRSLLKLNDVFQQAVDRKLKRKKLALNAAFELANIPSESQAVIEKVFLDEDKVTKIGIREASILRQVQTENGGLDEETVKDILLNSMPPLTPPVISPAYLEDEGIEDFAALLVRYKPADMSLKEFKQKVIEFTRTL